MIVIDILSAVPKLMDSFFAHSVIKKAINKKLVEINLINIRDYATDKHKHIDDYAFGGEAGMVLMIEPIYNAINDLKNKKHYDEVIYFSPDAEVITQRVLNTYSLKQNLLLLCGHYKGIDQRIRETLITKEFSLGHFVLSGGELPACVFTDGLVRLIPGAIGDAQSALSDSFQDNLISAPIYTRPQNFMGLQVPKILLKGNHQEIKDWQTAQSLNKTTQHNQ